MGRSWRGVVVLAIGMLAAGAMALSPALSAAPPLTKKKANKLYVNVGEKASDSELLDGIDSTGFLGAGATAADSSLLGGMSPGDFQPSYTRTIVVNPGTDATANGQALRNALASITTASITNPFLVKLEPGVYDVGTTPLQTTPFVDIEGSGRLTRIEGSGSSNPAEGVVMLGPSTELRFLGIANTGGAEQSRGVYLDGINGRLHNVAINVTQADDNAVGITVPSGTGVTITHTSVNARANSGGDATGIVVAGTTSVVDSDINASGDGSPNYGIRADAALVQIDRSFLRGTTDAVNIGGGSALIALSRIDGGVTGPNATCAGVYTPNNVFTASTCPA
ncbi:MAG: hypothetical protein ACRDJP_02805 [Actinomycetota bacterium]